MPRVTILEHANDEGTYKDQYKICTILFVRSNTSSLLMYQYWVMVVAFHNILKFYVKN